MSRILFTIWTDWTESESEDISDSNLPPEALHRAVNAKPALFLALMREINVAYCHQEGAGVMRLGVI